VVRAVSIIGHAESGKTGLITQLVPLLRAAGFRVGTVKHVSHAEAVDLPGKDTFRHRAAGAERTLLVSDSDVVLFSGRRPDEPLEETIERAFPGFDLVLVEGFKQGPFPKIEVYCRQGARGAEPLAAKLPVIAVVTADRVALPPGIPILSPAQPLRIVELLARRILGGTSA
jgi:molybdopterin-guanine dinucleotide biosynthesis protein B